jgi:hypothetical protein
MVNIRSDVDLTGQEVLDSFTATQANEVGRGKRAFKRPH